MFRSVKNPAFVLQDSSKEEQLGLLSSSAMMMFSRVLLITSTYRNTTSTGHFSHGHLPEAGREIETELNTRIRDEEEKDP